jgi:hypothetical protein
MVMPLTRPRLPDALAEALLKENVTGIAIPQGEASDGI